MLITLQQLKTSLQAMKTYITGILPTKVSDLTNDSGYLTTETDPTVPSWAKQSNKPSYTASEVGAVSDVQVNGTSVVDNGVANVPLATDSSVGVVRGNASRGVRVLLDNSASHGSLFVDKSSVAGIKNAMDDYRPIVPSNQHAATFYGLAKAAGDTTQKNSDNAVGTYTDDAKSAIKSMLGFLTDTDYATDQTAGIVRVNNAYGIAIAQNGLLSIDPATSTDIKAGTSLNPLVPIKQHVSTFYGLAKAAGDTTQASSDNAVGTYTDAAKTAIKSMLDIPNGGDYVTKDSVNNAGITGRTYTTLFNGEFSVTTATTSGYLKPYARASVTGRFNKENMHRVTINGTEYMLQTRMWYTASDSGVKVYEYLGNLSYYVDDVSGVPGGTDNVPFLIVSDLNNNSSIDVLTNSAGTYTIKVEKIVETKRQIPRSLLYNNYYEPILKKDASGSTYNGFSIGVNELNNNRATFAFGYGNKISNEFSQAFGDSNVISAANGIAFGSNNEVTDSFAFAFGYKTISNCNNMVAMGKCNVLANKQFDNWTNNTAYQKGDIVIASYAGINNVKFMCVVSHTSAASGTFQEDVTARYNETGNMGWVVAPSNGDTAFVIGNGSTANKRSNALKIDFSGNGYFNGDVYINCNADSTGGEKLATVNEIPDIKINGTSIVNDGVANIPVAGDGINSSYGVTRYAADYGVSQYQGYAAIGAATDTQIKNGTAVWKPIVAGKQHQAVFYGLAKVAGADMASSSNAVGTYTNEAKTAIQNMLGIPDGYVTKDSVNNAGISARTYTDLFNGEFSVTTATTSDYLKPYARASVTGRISKHYIYRVTVNDTVYTLRCRLWWESNNDGFKVYEYLGNIGLYINNASEVPGGTDNVNFVIISDLNNNNSIDVFTTTAGTYTIKVERINETLTKLPKSLIYQDSYQPFEVRNNGGTYNGFSVGVNTLANSARGTMAFGYCNNVGYDNEGFSIAFGVDNNISNDLGLAFGSHNQITGKRGIVIGNQSIASNGDAIVVGNSSTASGSGAVALGNANVASGMSSLAGNVMNTVSGSYSTVFGAQNNVSGSYCASFGFANIVNHAGQFVFGVCNVADPSTNVSTSPGNYIEIVGNGSSNNNRSNARTLDWSGNERLKGDVYVNCNADSTGGTKLATVNDVPDVQINGTSIVSNGIAQIPIANANTAGVVKADPTNGIGVESQNKLYINYAPSDLIKSGTGSYRPITPPKQHESVFYGLAKAAGDITQSSSSNAVGTYTDQAKTAIKSMIGVPTMAEIITAVHDSYASAEEVSF